MEIENSRHTWSYGVFNFPVFSQSPQNSFTRLKLEKVNVFLPISLFFSHTPFEYLKLAIWFHHALSFAEFRGKSISHTNFKISPIEKKKSPRMKRIKTPIPINILFPRQTAMYEIRTIHIEVLLNLTPNLSLSLFLSLYFFHPTQSSLFPILIPLHFISTVSRDRR